MPRYSSTHDVPRATWPVTGPLDVGTVSSSFALALLQAVLAGGSAAARPVRPARLRAVAARPAQTPFVTFTVRIVGRWREEKERGKRSSRCYKTKCIPRTAY